MSCECNPVHKIEHEGGTKKNPNFRFFSNLLHKFCGSWLANFLPAIKKFYSSLSCTCLKRGQKKRVLDIFQNFSEVSILFDQEVPLNALLLYPAPNIDTWVLKAFLLLMFFFKLLVCFFIGFFYIYTYIAGVILDFQK